MGSCDVKGPRHFTSFPFACALVDSIRRWTCARVFVPRRPNSSPGGPSASHSSRDLTSRGPSVAPQLQPRSSCKGNTKTSGNPVKTKAQDSNSWQTSGKESGVLEALFLPECLCTRLRLPPRSPSWVRRVVHHSLLLPRRGGRPHRSWYSRSFVTRLEMPVIPSSSRRQSRGRHAPLVGCAMLLLWGGKHARPR